MKYRKVTSKNIKIYINSLLRKKNKITAELYNDDVQQGILRVLFWL